MKKYRLQAVFIVPFVLQIVIAISLVGYLSHWNGQRAVNDVTARLRSEISARVEQQLLDFLSVPHIINQINADALSQGNLSDVNAESENYLWQQYQLFDNVNAIQFALPEGGQYLGIVKATADGQPYFQYRDESTGGKLHFYSINSAGTSGDLIRIDRRDYDPRVRPWYIEAVALGGPRWGKVEPAVTVQTLVLDASQPAYDAEGNLIGVLVVDIFLEQIDAFLEEIQVGETGIVYIMERSGNLVASSNAEPAFTIDSETGEPQRINSMESDNLMISISATALGQEFSSLAAISTRENLRTTYEGSSYFIQVTPIQDERGLDWLSVVVIPERDFTEQIIANTRLTILIIFAALGIAIIAGIITARWITRPILEINESAKALAAGDWQQEVTADRKDEVGELARSFNRMADQLRSAFTTLEERIEEQQAVEKALRISEEKYRTLVEAADDGIVLTNMNLEVIFHNEAYARNLGYTEEEIKDVDPLSTIHPDDFPRLMAETDNLLQSGSMTFEYRVRHKDGQWAHRLAKSAVIYDKDHNPESILTISHDMTVRKALEDQVQQQERLSAIGQLAAGIAHDFNNILSSIMLYADILIHLPDMPEKGQKHADTISKQSQRAANMVQQILDFSRRTPLDRHLVDLVYLLKELMLLTERTFPENIRVSLSHSAERHLADIDPTRMQQVFMNLMLNARDAMPAGGELFLALEAVTIYPDSYPHLATLSPGRWQKITVTDTGRGIPESHQAHLFEPFFTTKEPGQGTGLGLAQVYGIVQLHGGVIDVYSLEGQGTTFIIFLPIPEKTAELTAARPTTSDLQSGKGETILVVEDDEATREAVVFSIESLNYRVLVATNGREALAVLEESAAEISLIVSDMMMPQMGGEEFLRAMQARGIRIPTIILSGYLPEKDLDELRGLGMSDWISKPPELRTLANALARNLGSRRDAGARIGDW